MTHSDVIIYDDITQTLNHNTNIINSNSMARSDVIIIVYIIIHQEAPPRNEIICITLAIVISMNVDGANI